MTSDVQGHSDVLLADRCRSGESAAFEELYRAHSPRLFGLACRMVGRSHAEDLLQDIFLTAHRKLDRYRGESSLGTWLFRMATNVCIDHLRSRSNKNALLTSEFDEAVSPDELAAGSAGPVVGVVDRLDLERALADLPPGCRAVFVLHDVEGFEHREIAGLLGVAEGTSKSQLHKARMRLRRTLAAPGSRGRARS
ncbi:MAG: RNA polymerase sigma factor [Acidobacteria bacterium]|nr:RNA polymerase sigma factor [Acidobacteriota bacterium]